MVGMLPFELNDPHSPALGAFGPWHSAGGHRCVGGVWLDGDRFRSGALGRRDRDLLHGPFRILAEGRENIRPRAFRKGSESNRAQIAQRRAREDILPGARRAPTRLRVQPRGIPSGSRAWTRKERSIHGYAPGKRRRLLPRHVRSHPLPAWLNRKGSPIAHGT